MATLDLLTAYLAWGLVCGCLLFLGLFCLLQSWLHRDGVFALFGLYALAVTLGILAYTGIGSHLLWDNSPTWADLSVSIVANLAIGLGLWVVHRVSGAPIRYKFLTPMIASLIVIASIAGTALLVIARAQGVYFLMVWICLAIAYGLVCGWHDYRRGDKVGLWITFAPMPLAILMLWTVARILGWADYSWWTRYGVIIGLVVQVPLLLAGLTQRSQERHASQVRGRALSIRDALTGLLPPFLFSQRLGQAIQRLANNRANAAVLVVSLANHSTIKHDQGAPVAEQSILRAVIKLRQVLRDVDTAARLDETRFAIILEGVATREEVSQWAVRLLASGLRPISGLKPDVNLQFHVAALVLREHCLGADGLMQALCGCLDNMSPRTRRPIRFVEPEVTRPAQLDSMHNFESTPSTFQPGQA